MNDRHNIKIPDNFFYIYIFSFIFENVNIYLIILIPIKKLYLKHFILNPEITLFCFYGNYESFRKFRIIFCFLILKKSNY